MEKRVGLRTFKFNGQTLVRRDGYVVVNLQGKFSKPNRRRPPKRFHLDRGPK